MKRRPFGKRPTGSVARLGPPPGHPVIDSLTNDPAEWRDVGSYFGCVQTWQNRRNPEAFSTDGGVTHYLIAERKAVGLTATLRRSIRRSKEAK